MINYQDYIDEKVHQLRILTQAQWDYLKYSDITDWLTDNFDNDLEGKYYATKILLNTLYYSKKDIERLLEYGLYDKIFGEIVKKELINASNINIQRSEAEARINELMEKSFFIPLLDSDKPSESGNIISGDLVHKIGVKESQIDFHWNVTEEILSKFNVLIFVDDCLGSGSQFRNFWQKKINNIRDICKKLNIVIYYLVILGYNKTLIKLQQNPNLQDVNIIFCDILNESHRIFSDENTIWNKEENELEKVKEYFSKKMKDTGINFLGFNKLDFAVIIHDRLPNWSLPIFWKEMSGWKCLLRRKTTY